jgi:mono/diheme cytochrome c family protein
VRVLATGLVVIGGCAAPSRATPTMESTAAALPTLEPSQVARGRQLYVQSCASCHGQNAEGAANWEQPDERGDLRPPPHDDSGHTWRHSDAQLADIVRDGMRDPFNKTPELTMPAFSDSLRDEDIAAMIAYFKSLWSSEHRLFQEAQNQRTPVPIPSPAVDP